MTGARSMLFLAAGMAAVLAVIGVFVGVMAALLSLAAICIVSVWVFAFWNMTDGTIAGRVESALLRRTRFAAIALLAVALAVVAWELNPDGEHPTLKYGYIHFILMPLCFLLPRRPAPHSPP
jgi:hypothetical protein